MQRSFNRKGQRMTASRSTKATAAKPPAKKPAPKPKPTPVLRDGCATHLVYEDWCADCRRANPTVLVVKR